MVRILTLLVLLSSCMSGGEDDFDRHRWREDFSLDDREENKNDQVKGSGLTQIEDRSSLPLYIKVGKHSPGFEGIPKLAYPHYAQMEIQVKGCGFKVATGPSVVDQYLRTNQWVKLKQAIPSGETITIDPHRHGAFQVELDLRLVAMRGPGCRGIVGKKFYVGRFDLRQSKMGLIVSKRSPRVQFNQRSGLPQSTRVYLQWPKDARKPELVDEFGMGVTLKTTIFRARFRAKGSYYLVFKPVLNFIHSEDSQVLRSPHKKPTLTESKNQGHTRARPFRQKNKSKKSKMGH